MSNLKPPRAIKFRLRSGNGIVGYEWWWRGDVEQGPKWLYSKDGTKNWSSEFIPHTDKDQFVGLPDKNGTEIYEGDVCKNEYGWRGVITWDSAIPIGERSAWTGWWWHCAEKRDGKFPFHIDKKTEVIGNVYQNPGLLKEKNQ